MEALIDDLFTNQQTLSIKVVIKFAVNGGLVHSCWLVSIINRLWRRSAVGDRVGVAVSGGEACHLALHCGSCVCFVLYFISSA